MFVGALNKTVTEAQSLENEALSKLGGAIFAPGIETDIELPFVYTTLNSAEAEAEAALEGEPGADR